MAARHTQRQSSAVDLSQAAGMGRQTELLSQLRDVTCATSGVFMQDLTELSRLVQSVPLQVPTGQGYVLELKDGALHVSGKSSGIETFELSDPTAHISKVLNNSDGLLLEIRKGRDQFTVVLHRDAHESGRRTRASARTETRQAEDEIRPRASERTYTERLSSPWRAPATHSESRGGCSSAGER